MLRKSVVAADLELSEDLLSNFLALRPEEVRQGFGRVVSDDSSDRDNREGYGSELFQLNLQVSDSSTIAQNSLFVKYAMARI